MSVAGLRAYDSGLKLGTVNLSAANPAATPPKPQRYCLDMDVSGKSAFVVRPAVTPGATGASGGDVANGTCAANAPAGW